MTSVAGFVAAAPAGILRQKCREILGTQTAYSSCRPAFETAEGACFGAALFRLLPEDKDSHAAMARDGRFHIVADIRLDNREEIAAAVGLARPLAQTGDAQLLLAAWARWQEAALDRIEGDFAFAIFDEDERRLTLARDATGQRPLHFARSRDGIGFATMPSGLLELPEFQNGWDLDRFSQVLRGFRRDDPRTYFQGIYRVLPGQVVHLTPQHISSRTYWNPLSGARSRLTCQEAADQLGEHLQDAVRARMRRREGPVATHLSSGLDSSAVTASAASLFPGEVIAFTSAPLEGFDGPVPRGRIADESPLATITAKRYGLEHQIVRSDDFTLEYLKRQALLYQEPARNLLNDLWARPILGRAANAGAKILLNGNYGNLTLNAGGLYALADWLRSYGPVATYKQIRAAAGRSDVRWRGALFATFAPWLPARVWLSLVKSILGIPDTGRTNFVRDSWAKAGKDYVSALADRPQQDSRLFRMRMIREQDSGMINKGGIADSGVMELEPLADRRLIDFSLNLAPEHLLRDGDYRPVARSALNGLLPKEILNAPLRGMQSADWQLRFPQPTAQHIMEEVESCATAGALLDLDAMKAAIRDWPHRSDGSIATIMRHSNMLPAALGAGIFIKEFESRWRSSSSARSPR